MLAPEIDGLIQGPSQGAERTGRTLRGAKRRSAWPALPQCRSGYYELVGMEAKNGEPVRNDTGRARLALRGNPREG